MAARLRYKLTLYGALTLASVKAYFRSPVALFFSLFFPAAFMLIFGLFDFSGDGGFVVPDVGIVDNAGNAHSAALVSALGGIDELDVHGEGDEASFREQLATDDLDVLLIIPSDFALAGEPRRAELQLLYSAARVVELGVTRAVVEAVLSGQFTQSQEIPAQYLPENYFSFSAPQPVASSEDSVEFSYILFLIPGILAMAAMQSSIFGSVFTLIRFKVAGVLKRLQATPAGPMPLLVSQGLTTVVILVVQTLLLLAVGVGVYSEFRELLLDRGVLSLIATFVLVLIGGSIFVGAGLAISGVGKSEQGASAVANLVTFPMLFLSGVFFPTDVLPDWLLVVTRYLPLSFLIDALRDVILNGAMLWDSAVALNILGMAAWSAALFIVARFTFRWE